MIEFADLVLEPEQYRARRDGRVLHATTFQFQLLTFFVENPYRVFTLPELGRAVWPEQNVSTVAVRRSVVRLRTVLNASGGPNLIRTVRGVGYSLDNG